MDHDTQSREEKRDPGDAPDAADAKRQTEEHEADEQAPDATVPFDPETDDESPLGDTEEHSSA